MLRTRRNIYCIYTTGHNSSADEDHVTNLIAPNIRAVNEPRDFNQVSSVQNF